MKILKIRVSNIFGIRELELSPQGKSMVITGGNAKGKSSILKAIEAGFVGAGGSAVYAGSDKGEIMFELEELEIDRVIDANKGSRLEVVQTSGAVRMRQDKPQAFLDRIAAGLAFNPVAFYLAKPAKKREMVLQALPLQVTEEQILERLTFHGMDEGIAKSFLQLVRPDWNAHGLEILKRLYDGAYSTRHEIGQRLKTKTEVVNVLSSSVGNGEPHDPERLQFLQTQKDDIEKAQRNLRDLEEKRGQRTRRMKEIAEEIDRIEKKRLSLVEERNLLAREGAETLESIRGIQAFFVDKTPDDALGEINQVIREQLESQMREKMAADQIAKHKDAQKEAAELATQRDEFDNACTVLQRTIPREIIAASKLPIPGLAVEGDAVSIDGVSIDHLSGAEQLTVALKIAQNLIPANGLRVLCVDGAERLDVDSFEILEGWAKKGDFQFFITRVTEGDRQVETLS